MLQRMIGRQYGRPSGLLGHIIGLKMIRDHLPENLWTITGLHAQPADHILEIGSGAGYAISELARLVPQGRVVGLDRSRTMVRLAGLRNARAIRRGIVRLQHGDATHLPFPDGAFDKVFSIHAIYFWQQPAHVLREIRRVLKPGGTATLTALPRERWPGGPDAITNTPEFTAYTGAELRHLMLNGGFRSVTIRADPDHTYRSNFSIIGMK